MLIVCVFLVNSLPTMGLSMMGEWVNVWLAWARLGHWTKTRNCIWTANYITLWRVRLVTSAMLSDIVFRYVHWYDRSLLTWSRVDLPTLWNKDWPKSILIQTSLFLTCVTPIGQASHNAPTLNILGLFKIEYESVQHDDFPNLLLACAPFWMIAR